MARVIRNFWINAKIDGQATELSGGPKSKEDGMSIKILQRNDGEITTAFDIECFVDTEGNLVTSIRKDGKVVAERITVR